MVRTWVFVWVLISEFTIYFILEASKKVFPREVTKPFRTTAFFYVLCSALLIMGGVSLFSYQDIKHSLVRLRLLHHRVFVIKDLGVNILRMESLQRGFLITNQKTYLDLYYGDKERLPAQYKAVRELCTDLPEKIRVEELITAIENRVSVLEKTS